MGMFFAFFIFNLFTLCESSNFKPIIRTKRNSPLADRWMDSSGLVIRVRFLPFNNRTLKTEDVGWTVGKVIGLTKDEYGVDDIGAEEEDREWGDREVCNNYISPNPNKLG